MYSRLFFFNPTNEMAIANGEVSYMPPRHLHHFEMDMAALPWLLGNEKDYILVRQKGGNSIQHLEPFNWNLPTLVSSPEEISSKDRHNLWFSPWGWSPAVYRHFKPWMSFSHPEWSLHPFAIWQKDLANILSRATSYQLLKKIYDIKKANRSAYPLITIPDLPMEILDEKNLSTILTELSPPLIVKTPFSASGRGLFRIRTEEDAPEKSPWIKGMLKNRERYMLKRCLKKFRMYLFNFI